MSERERTPHTARPADAALLREIATSFVSAPYMADRLRALADQLENGRIVARTVVERSPLFVDPRA